MYLVKVNAVLFFPLFLASILSAQSFGHRQLDWADCSNPT